MKPLQVPEVISEFRFPLAGLDVSAPFGLQPNLRMPDGDYARTTARANNVRSLDPLSDRMRGGCRPGLIKHILTQVSGSNPIQGLANVVVTSGTLPGSGSVITAMAGFSGVIPGFTGARIGSYDSASGVQAGYTLTDTNSGMAPSQISARGFLSGGVNESYTTIGILDDSSTVVTLGFWLTGTGGTVPKYGMTANGRLIFSTLRALPGTDINVRSLSAAGGTYHYIGGIQSGGAQMLAAIDDAGDVVWSNVSAGATSETGSFPYASMCLHTSYICTLYSVGGTGLVRNSITDGTGYTVLKTKAAIEAAVPGYSISSADHPSIARAGNTIAVAISTFYKFSFTAEHSGGLVFINVSTGNITDTVTGLQTSPASVYAQSSGGNEELRVKVVSDGTDFYVLLIGKYRSATKNCVVKKIQASDGSVVWTTNVCEFWSAYVPTIAYLSGNDTIQVNGPNYSVSLDATAGTVVGSGVIPDSATVYSLQDAGTVTVDSVSVITPTDVLLSVSAGNVKVAADGTWASVQSGSSSLATFAQAPVIRSAQAYGYIYWADGINAKRYSSSNNTMETWTPTFGSLPGTSGARPKLIALWQGRIVLSGLATDPRNWFMSAIGDPLDWEYGASPTTAATAVAGNSTRQFGVVGDVITALIPFTDDVLIFGCANSIYMLRGNPMDGGRIDPVTRSTGVVFGNAWCQDAYGNIYFMSQYGSVYRMTPGEMPVRVTQQIDKLLREVNQAQVTVTLQWDDVNQGVNVFITPNTVGLAASHYFFEQKAGGWWPMSFANVSHNPRCVHVFQGNQAATPQIAVIGSDDGYVRTFSSTAGSDDGTSIESNVVIGPILTKELDFVTWKDIQMVLGEESGPVAYEIFVGSTAEEALAATSAVRSGTWRDGRNYTTIIRRDGHALYLEMSATNYWSMESARIRYSRRGKVLGRGA